jgi:hypothetical protein
MRTTQELLGAPTIGRGNAQPGGGGGGSQRSQENLPSCPECTKMAQNGWLTALTDFKNGERKKTFLLKST